MDDVIGSIEPGKRADLVLFDTRRPQWRTLFNPVNNLVYSADGRSVHTVIVNGRVVVRDHAPTFVDEWELIQEVAGFRLGHDEARRGRVRSPLARGVSYMVMSIRRRGKGEYARDAVVILADPESRITSEKAFADLWERSLELKPEVIGLDGKSYEILFPGVRNQGAGPDFEGAVLRYDGRTIGGDVRASPRLLRMEGARSP